MDHKFGDSEEIKLLKEPEGSDYKVKVVFENLNLILQINPLEEGGTIKSTKFVVQVNNPNLGFRDSQLHVLSKEEKVLEVTRKASTVELAVSKDEQDKAANLGILIGKASSLFNIFNEMGAVLSGLSSLDPSGVFAGFS